MSKTGDSNREREGLLNQTEVAQSDMAMTTIESGT